MPDQKPRQRFEVILEAMPADVPAEVRLRLLLKIARRTCELKCLSAEELPFEFKFNKEVSPMRMMKMEKSEGAYGVDVGTYRAKFLGTFDTEHEQYGPGIEWKFEILDGPFRGKLASRTTAVRSTARNSAGLMLNCITGGRAIGEGADVDSYVDRVYRITVGENSTGKGTCVKSATALDEQASAAASAPSKQAPSPPPARKPAPPARKPLAASEEDRPELKTLYWVEQADGTAREMSGKEINDLIVAGKLSEDVGVMDYEQSGGWKTAKDFQLNLPF